MTILPTILDRHIRRKRSKDIGMDQFRCLYRWDEAVARPRYPDQFRPIKRSVRRARPRQVRKRRHRKPAKRPAADGSCIIPARDSTRSSYATAPKVEYLL